MDAQELEFDDEQPTGGAEQAPVVAEQPAATPDPVDPPADTPPETGDTPEGAAPDHAHRVEFTPEQQEVFDKAINKKVYEAREAQRKAEEAERLRQEAEERLRAAQEPQRPSVPPKPDDPFAPDYDEQVNAWAESLAAQKAYDERVAVAHQQREMAQYQAQQEAERAMQQKTAEYFDRGSKLGLAQADLNQASATLNQFGISPEVGQHLMGDDRGPEMAVYLANNLAELEQVSQMTPMQAAVHLETVVKQKAMRPSPQLTPPPAKVAAGAGAPAVEDGITLE